MKKNQLFRSVFVHLLFLCFTSCDKEEDKEPTNSEMLTANSWQGEKAMIQGVDVSTIPQFADKIPDLTTLTLTFSKDGSYTSAYTHNGQVFPTSGNWEFRENETKLHFDLLSAFGLNQLLGIQELSASRLTLTTIINYELELSGLKQNVSVPAEIYFVSM